MSNLTHSENTNEDRFEVRFLRYNSRTHKLERVQLAGAFNDFDKAVECWKEYIKKNNWDRGGGKIRDIEEGKIWKYNPSKDKFVVAFNL